MRTSDAALALITRCNSAGATEYLTQWNDAWQAYSLIGGHVEEGETFRQACVREVVEELSCPEADVEVGPCPYASLRFREYSRAAQEETDYHWQVFITRVSESVLQALSEEPGECAWVTADHIRSCRTTNGEPIADQVRRVLKAVDEAELGVV